MASHFAHTGFTARTTLIWRFRELFAQIIEAGQAGGRYGEATGN